MLKVREIQEIYRKISDGQINKDVAIDQLISIIGTNRNPEICASILEIFDKLNVKVDKVFKILENSLISDEVPLIRAISAKILLKLFPNKCVEPIKWAIKKDQSYFVIREIGRYLEENNHQPYYRQFRDAFEKKCQYFFGFDKNDENIKAMERFFGLGSTILIDECKNSYIKASYIDSLGTMNVKTKKIFEFLEKMIHSNKNPLVKKTAEKAILYDFPVKDMNPLDWKKHLDKYWAQIHVREGVIPKEAEILGLLGKSIGLKLERYFKELDEDQNENICSYWINEEGQVIGIYLGAQDVSLKSFPGEIRLLEYLEELDLGDNFIEDIQEWTSRIKNLKI